MTPSLDFPNPNAETQAQSDACVNSIKQLIREQGKIDFPTYMQHALYAPHHGYYTSGLQKFGALGDFVTAPEISPLFSQTLANHVAHTLKNTKAQAILEFGPGRGKMAADILLQLEKCSRLPEKYYCLELSPHLQKTQLAHIESHCPHLLSRVEWLDKLPDTPFEGAILANEILDAMPVHLFELGANGLAERFVALDQDQLTFVSETPSDTVEKHASRLIEKYNLNTPYQSEINTMITPWLRSAGDCLTKGSITLIDYGFLGKTYYHPQRNTGTLMCHYQHRNHPNPLFMPGITDITAHVDFTQVMDAADTLGLTIEDFDTQANFLLKHGITELFDANITNNPAEQMALSANLQTLLFPHEMGELFKVITLTKNG